MLANRRDFLRSALAIQFTAAVVVPARAQVSGLSGQGGGGPMRIAILADTSEAAASSLVHMRAALLAFVETIAPEHEVLVASTGRRLEVRAQPTTDRAKIKAAVTGLLADNGPTPLVDSLREIDERFMRKTTDRAPVFVIVTADGTESSSRTDDKAFNVWGEDLMRRRVVVHAIVLKIKGNGAPEAVAGSLARSTGGHFETISSGQALPEKLKIVAERIQRDYEQRWRR